MNPNEKELAAAAGKKILLVMAIKWAIIIAINRAARRAANSE